MTRPVLVEPGQVWRGRGPRGGRFVRIIRVRPPRPMARGTITEAGRATAYEVSRHNKRTRGKRDGLRRDLPLTIQLTGHRGLEMPPGYTLYDPEEGTNA